MEGNFVAPVFEKSDEDVEFLLDALADNFVFNTLDEFELETRECLRELRGAVDQVTFRKLLATHTIQNDNQTKVVLRKVPFLSDLDDEFMNRIADALTTVHYESGEVIFERGSEGSVFFVIQEGKVEYEHKKRGIKVLGPGDYFGEQAIVKNEPRRADATAVKDMFMLALSRDAHLSERFLGPLT
ncbi:hypothetical protein ACHAXA_008775 [Cyclostephanos tholiformis]|uniref:Cyclic nucleotide-binding domain-containing protein n=1 Tax=Cyclostephanos tholiformis TaxID=382380 RepID=A0ABD3R655_9STRA